MIGVAIADRTEWFCVLQYFQIHDNQLQTYPYGEYFEVKEKEQILLFYYSGARKVNASGACQYFLDHFPIQEIVVIGTACGIDPTCHELDIIFPDATVQVDCLGDIAAAFDVELPTVTLNCQSVRSGILGTADRPILNWDDFLKLKKLGIVACDMEAGAISWICIRNQIPCFIIKGITDFPTEEPRGDMSEDAFVRNVPLVMQTILQQYLPLLLEKKNHSA